MKETLSERRKAENEVYFRENNEKVQEGFDAINKIAEEQGDEAHIYDSKDTLLFFCECSDEKCTQRVEVSLDNYNVVHRNRRAFVIVPEHDVEKIERVIDKKPKYWVVEKKVEPPETATTLNVTDSDNA